MHPLVPAVDCTWPEIWQISLSRRYPSTTLVFHVYLVSVLCLLQLIYEWPHPFPPTHHHHPSQTYHEQPCSSLLTLSILNWSQIIPPCNQSDLGLETSKRECWHAVFDVIFIQSSSPTVYYLIIWFITSVILFLFSVSELNIMFCFFSSLVYHPIYFYRHLADNMLLVMLISFRHLCQM